ncbi:alpha/beta hydrolase [Mycobacterium florentinum]|uniref:Alpha/beta hydrolase n=1 Tax=Mycobacterium florentinum TaxID=292462 RepID=A0A1X1U4T0_MYCFL|nr:alpha/beta hydrolase [Mycobacterium florentinum]MCV7409262.1 alpha/beta hydrolase [Mycobacterium florentinum]ORV51852.1 alpha/beta hydrolase [Mycobacterium florentinum]
MSTYVLIPGAWHGAWSWRLVAERLRAAGHRAITLTLPGMNDGDDPSRRYRLQDAIEYIVDQVRRLESGNVVLVAHSWGGYPATGAAALLPDRVERLVYYNGHVPLPGRSLVDENPPDKRLSALRWIAESPVGAVPATLQYVEQELMQGVSADLQRFVANMLTLQPGRYFLDSLDIHPLDLGIPMTYITGADDRAMPRPADESAARIGVQPIVVPGTHNGLLTHPDEVAKAILAA